MRPGFDASLAYARPGDIPPGTPLGTVTCTLVPQGGVYDRAGLADAATAEATMLFDEAGQVLYLSITVPGGHEDLLSFHSAFGTWLQEAHPDVFAATYDKELVDEVGIDTCLSAGRQYVDESGEYVGERCLIDTMAGRVLWAQVLDEFLAQSEDYPVGG